MAIAEDLFRKLVDEKRWFMQVQGYRPLQLAEREYTTVMGDLILNDLKNLFTEKEILRVKPVELEALPKSADDGVFEIIVAEEGVKQIIHVMGLNVAGLTLYGIKEL